MTLFKSPSFKRKLLFDNSIEYLRKVIILLWLLKMQVLHKVTVSVLAENSSEGEKADMTPSPNLYLPRISEYWLPLFSSPLVGNTIMIRRKKIPANSLLQRSCMKRSRFLCQIPIGTIFKSDVERKHQHHHGG